MNDASSLSSEEAITHAALIQAVQYHDRLWKADVPNGFTAQENLHRRQRAAATSVVKRARKYVRAYLAAHAGEEQHLE